jgi:hypothetical protein
MARIPFSQILTVADLGVEQIGHEVSRRPAAVRQYSVVDATASRCLVQAPDRSGWQEMCGRCGGKGFLPWFAGIHGGVCYECNGLGVSGKLVEAKTLEVLEEKLRRWGRTVQLREAKREAERLAYVAQREADGAAWRAANADLAAWCEQATDEQAEPVSDAVRTVRIGFAPSAAEEGALRRRIADLAAKSTLRFLDAAIGERVSVTGTVRAAITCESTFGWRTEYSKLVIVEGTGEFAGMTFKFYSKAKLAWELERGDALVLGGEVKKFTTRDEVPQTELGRPKFSPAA